MLGRASIFLPTELTWRFRRTPLENNLRSYDTVVKYLSIMGRIAPTILHPLRPSSHPPATTLSFFSLSLASSRPEVYVLPWSAQYRCVSGRVGTLLIILSDSKSFIGDLYYDRITIWRLTHSIVLNSLVNILSNFGYYYFLLLCK